MKSYQSSLTSSYKTGYIYSAVIDGQDVFKYQVDKYAYVQYCNVDFKIATLNGTFNE